MMSDKITKRPWLWVKHGPEWRLENTDGSIVLDMIGGASPSDPVLACTTGGLLEELTPNHPDAAFIVHAANNYEALVEALEALLDAPNRRDAETVGRQTLAAVTGKDSFTNSD